MPIPPPPDARRIPLWSLRDDVLVEPEPGGDGAVLLTRWGEVAVRGVGRRVVETLRRMTFGPVFLDNVVAGGTPDRRRLAELLEGLQYVLVRSLGTEDAMGPLLSVVPVDRESTFRPDPGAPGRPVRLSRMASLRAEDGVLVLESPLAGHRVVLHQPVARAVTAALGGPTTPGAVAASLGLSTGLAVDLVGYLSGTGMVVPGDGPDAAAAEFAEDADPALLLWSYQGLLFHSRGRAGRREEPAPGTDPGAGRRVPLHRPELAAVLAADPPLTAAVEARRSWSRFGPAPVTAEQLGELLHRTARARPGDGPPYPDGPHDLQLYPIVARCAGIPPGVYHYDPREHALVAVAGSADAVAGLVEAARVAGGMAEPPPLLIAVTARFRRLARADQDGAYAGTLARVGALLQTLSLVATAMGLAPCAVVPDDEDGRTVRALHLDWRTESDLGELVLGTRPDRITPNGAIRPETCLAAIDRPDLGIPGSSPPEVG
jgi:SagB-type dehydrogenase family enzyme